MRVIPNLISSGWRWYFQYVLYSREFDSDFCIGSFKKSQNVTFRNYLHDVNLKTVPCWLPIRRRRVLCFVLSHNTWWDCFVAVKMKETARKRISDAQRKVSSLKRITSIPAHFNKWDSKNIRALRVRGTDRKSFLTRLPRNLRDEVAKGADFGCSKFNWANGSHEEQ